MEKDEKEKAKEKPKDKPRVNLQVISLILIVVLILIVLIVVQVPYTTTKTISEPVPVEKCAQENIPFVSNFRTGLNYDNSLVIYPLNESGLYKYSELKTNFYTTIRNIGDEKGIYCINAEVYLINDNTNEELDNEGAGYPFCTEKPISAGRSDIISLWTPNVISKDIHEQYDLDNVYVLFTIVPPTSQKCHTEYVEETSEQEVTRYCNAWKHLVGKC